MTPAPSPIKIAPIGLTKPLAGVIATSPATAPAAAPSTLGLPLCAQLTVIHVMAAIAVATCVTTNALVARAPEASALPALNPNQPNQRSDAPSTTMVPSCGSSGSSPNPSRLPSTIAATRAEIPELMCTTVPPAKSRAPIARSMPGWPAQPLMLGAPAMPVQLQTQWAMGSYTTVAHISVMSTNALDRIRSASWSLLNDAAIT